jgi:hypothetical protein
VREHWPRFTAHDRLLRYLTRALLTRRMQEVAQLAKKQGQARVLFEKKMVLSGQSNKTCLRYSSRQIAALCDRNTAVVSGCMISVGVVTLESNGRISILLVVSIYLTATSAEP